MTNVSPTENQVTINSLDQMYSELAELSKLKFLFVLGMPKSGTTWMQNILHAHPEIICRGETNIKMRWQEPIRQCVDDYNKKVDQGGFDKVYFDEGDHDFLFLNGVLMMMRAWVREANSSQLRMVAERTPNFMSKRISLFNKFFPESKFLHIIRDPRDAAVSGWFFWQRRAPGEMEKRYRNADDFFDDYFSGWITQIEKCRQASESVPSRYHECRYEELVANPKKSVEGILRYLEVSYSPSIVHDCVDLASFKRVAGRPRGEEDYTGHKLRKGIVGDWVNHLDCDRIAIKYGAVLRQFGYE